MVIKFKERTISSFDEWKDAFVESKSSSKKKVQWKEERSACSLAKFIMQHNGQAEIEAFASEAIGKTVSFQNAKIEHVIAFDRHGKGSHRDLTLSGKTEDGETVFVTVEAKVDENFGNWTIRKYHEGGEKTNSKKRPRLELLCQRLMGKSYEDVSNKDLRYQLFHATVATIDGCPTANHHIMLVLVFNTELANAKEMSKNHQDYQQFLEEIGAAQEKIGDAECHSALVATRDLQDKKKVFFIYKKKEAQGW